MEDAELAQAEADGGRSEQQRLQNFSEIDFRIFDALRRSELDSDSQVPINMSTSAVLVSPGVAAPGTISITASEVYFEVDEEHRDFKKIDPQVGKKKWDPVKKFWILFSKE